MDDTQATAIAADPTPPAPDPSLCPACKKEHAGSETATLKKLAQTPTRLAKLLNGIDAGGLEKSYAPGKWSIRQIVCHLRDCELVFGVRWRKIVSEENAQLMPFDQDCWAAKTGYTKQHPWQSLATLALLRATNLEMLKLAGRPALARSGIHAEYGPITVAQMARHLLAHDENHLAQISKAKENVKASARPAAKVRVKVKAKPATKARGGKAGKAAARKPARKKAAARRR